MSSTLPIRPFGPPSPRKRGEGEAQATPFFNNLLVNTAVHEDVPWDETMGYGIPWATAAIAWLETGFAPFIRMKGVGGAANSANESPDIIFLESDSHIAAARSLGQSFKHLGGDELDDSGGRYAFVRVQNHGKEGGTCRVTLAGIVGPGSSISLIEPRTVDLDPGGFEVVGPFTLGSLPRGTLLVAEAARKDDPHVLAHLAAALVPPVTSRLKHQFAFREYKA